VGLRNRVVAVEWLQQLALDKALIPVDDVNYENRGSQLHSGFVFASRVQPSTERIATASVVVERDGWP